MAELVHDMSKDAVEARWDSVDFSWVGRSSWVLKGKNALL